MSKLTIPLNAVESGGALQNWYYNNCVLRSDVVKSNDGVSVIARDTFQLTLAEVAAIVVTNGGEVEEYLMAIRAPLALLEQVVPVGLPKREQFDGTELIFRYWFERGVEVWVKDDNTELIFYTNPFAGDANEYLKGSEIAIINSISASVTVITVASADLVTSAGWTKV